MCEGGVKVFHSPRFGSPRLGDTGGRFAEADGDTGRPGCVLIERVSLLLGAWNGRKPPRFPLAFAVAGLPALLVAPIFVPLAELAVPALGFPAPVTGVPRDSVAPEAMERPPAATGETWCCCMDCWRCAVCCWNDGGRAVLCLPKKRRDAAL